jgi:hypothetical protein
MRRVFGIRLALGLALGLALLGVSQANGQNKDKKDEKKTEKKGDASRVKFETYDQVEIHGTFYESAEGKRSPCVLLLHDLTGKSQDEGWDKLARDLQQRGYAVLSFDFRGHGDSTSVSPAFWAYPDNKKLKNFSPTKPKDKFSYKDIADKSYYLRMVDDIAAAKLYLDRRNDAGDCNSSTLIVIGAGEGAALGALWMNSEFYRYGVAGPPIGFGPRKLATAPEGRCAACAVWLSVSSTVGAQPGVREWLRNIGGKEKVPMYFIYGAKDSKAEGFAQATLGSIKTGAASLPLTGSKAIADTDLKGQRLIGKGQDTGEFIVKYLDKVIKERGTNDWDKREVDKNAYVWVIPPSRQLVAKNEKEKNLNLLPLPQFLAR